MAEHFNGNFFDEAYFENGVVSGKSGYTNYQWLPDLTLPMAHHIIQGLGLTQNDRVLDYGCAKGYLVRALRLLGIDAFGVDISEYALSHCHESVKSYCSTIDGKLYKESNGNFRYVIAKDVFEHVDESTLEFLLKDISKITSHLFIAVPLAKKGSSTEFVIPAYHMDRSHITIRDRAWWESLISAEFEITRSSYTFKGCKENWTSTYPEGNLFLVATSKHARFTESTFA